MRVGFQGEKGAYSELACIKHFGRDINTVGYKKFEDVFNALKEHKINYGILPIENTITGIVTDTYDLLLKYKLFIAGEIFLRIEHCLLGLNIVSLKKIKKVYSHPQALSQCRDFIEKNNFEQVATYDAAGSVKLIKNDKDEAVIASELAAKVYNLKILKKNIETDNTNTTRFIIISSKECNLRKLKNIKTSVVFITRHKPGALVNSLIGFRDNKINLTKIESRPLKNKPFEYSFYLDFEGSKNDKSVMKALEVLNGNSSFVRVLGSYPQGY